MNDVIFECKLLLSQNKAFFVFVFVVFASESFNEYFSLYTISMYLSKLNLKF